MKPRSLLVLSVFVLAGLFFGFSKSVRAQDDQDPPTRVARLSYVQGSVSYQPAGEDDWVQADVDRPLTTGDSLWTDENSRGEFHIGSTALRIAHDTGISFLNLDDQAVQIQLAQGVLRLRVRQLNSDKAYEIDTPNLAFSIVRPGEYRFDADPNGGSTIVTVYDGEGIVTGGGRTYNIRPGERAIFSGTDRLSENVQAVRGPDPFDGWARSREDREEHVVSARYVSPEMTGYEDLDDYGSWRSDPEYGNYWVPNNAGSDWQPYHEGHWAWVAPWGWTWVDNEPWGFAPFHYGRWAMIGNSWGWVPGPVAVAPVYSPAVVGFVGGGGYGVPVGFGSGEGVGWFPLGPRDVYVPAYRVSPRYVERINESNTRVVNHTTITNVYNYYTVNHVTNVNYAYATNTRAVTVVNRDAFVGGRPVARSAMHVSTAEIEHPRVVTTTQLTPSRASVIGTAAVARAKPPAAIANRRVVTKMTPAPQAEPMGRPRPSTNPNLSSAVLNRSGYSPQLQAVRAKAAAAAPARGMAPNEPNRPATPEARPGSPRQPNRPAENPNRAPTPPNQPRPNEALPNRPFTPTERPSENPNRPTHPPVLQPQPETRPRGATPSERQPNHNRPIEQPRPEIRQPEEARPTERRPSRPAEEARPEANPRTAPASRHPETRPAERPKESPPGQEKPKEKPRPQPQDQPQ